MLHLSHFFVIGYNVLVLVELTYCAKYIFLVIQLF